MKLASDEASLAMDGDEGAGAQVICSTKVQGETAASSTDDKSLSIQSSTQIFGMLSSKGPLPAGDATHELALAGYASLALAADGTSGGSQALGRAGARIDLPGASTAQIALIPPEAPPWVAAGPAAVSQMLQVMMPLREMPDGAYQMGFSLSPPDLGVIRVVVTVRSGELVSVRFWAGSPEGHAALADALSDLAAQLSASGVSAGHVLLAGGHFASEHGNSKEGQGPHSQIKWSPPAKGASRAGSARSLIDRSSTGSKHLVDMQL
ncbi:MAG: flagellar hook-length control protein FliK [Actinobacteria bacterium]|nr:flagellar hook-length control protein FliK [Actinomycetota bacterium]